MALPAAIFFALLFFAPLSPRWLVARGRIDEARRELAGLGTDAGDGPDGGRGHPGVAGPGPPSPGRAVVPAGQYRKPILLAVAIAMFNQLSGINALMYYAPAIFKMAGAKAARGACSRRWPWAGRTSSSPCWPWRSSITSAAGRLMLVGSIGYILSLGSTAWAFYAYGDVFAAAVKAVECGHRPLADVAAAASTGGTVVLVSLLVFIASHAFGQGAVIWVFISEIFPNRVRARGQALGSFTHWVMAAADLLDLSDHRRPLRRLRLRLLRRDDGAATGMGPAGHARDQGRFAGRDSDEAEHRVTNNGVGCLCLPEIQTCRFTSPLISPLIILAMTSMLIGQETVSTRKGRSEARDLVGEVDGLAIHLQILEHEGHDSPPQEKERGQGVCRTSI